MFAFLLALITNPMVIVSLVVGIAVLVGLYFAAPQLFLKVALHPVTWLVILGIAMASGYMHLSNQNAELKTEIQQTKPVIQAKDDSAVTLHFYHDRQKTRQAEKDRIGAAITHAQPGQAYDDALDEIARIQNQPSSAPVDRHAGDKQLRNNPDGVVKP